MSMTPDPIPSSHQKKILPIDDHVGVSIAGLTADARTISRWMRTECLNSRWTGEWRTRS